MKKKIIVSAFVFILIIILTIVVASLLLKGSKTKTDTENLYLNANDWVEEVGYDACAQLVKGIEGLKFSIKGNKSGVIINFYYKNLDKVNKEEQRVIKEKMMKLSKTFTFSLVSYGIEIDNANCVINVRANKSSKPSISLINNDCIL